MVAEHIFNELEFWGWHMAQAIVTYAQNYRNNPNDHYTHNYLNAHKDLYAQMDQLNSAQALVKLYLC